VNLLVRKIIYDYMYPVDLENNERSCEYSAIVEYMYRCSSSNFQGYCDTTSQIVLFTKYPRPARMNKIYHPSEYLSINLKKINLSLVYFVVGLSFKKRGGRTL
jgi:hypothetical protein